MDAETVVALDAMGGDKGPSIVISAALRILDNYPHVKLILVGQASKLHALLDQKPVASKWLGKKEDKKEEDLPKLTIVHAESVVAMGDKPSQVLRRKQDSSMSIALELLQNGKAQACVSAGNTGALMLLGRSIVSTHPCVDRPAIVKLIPSLSHRCYVLDLGANVDCRAQHLVQFAMMGSVLSKSLDGKKEPRVALLNVGEEEAKGSEQVRLASRLLTECDGVNYIGYVEGSDLYKAVADVIVCDGFVGNVALKSGEGLVEMILDLAGETFSKGCYARLVKLMARPLIGRLGTILDLPRHNGASLIGLRGTVVKSHGNADARAFYSAIEQAIFEAENDVPAKINQHLDQFA